MALRETIQHMRELLAAISVDLEKAVGGNKAASQRVRTGTIKLEKIAKEYRKESIADEKKQGPKKAQKHAASHAKHKAAAKKPQPKTVKANPRAKALHAPHKNKPGLRNKRSTAKIPVKRR